MQSKYRAQYGNNHALTHPSSITYGILRLLESLPSSEKGSIIEHIVALRIQRPVAPLARLLIISSNFHKTFIQRQIVPD